MTNAADQLPDVHEATVLPEWIDYNGHVKLS